MSGGKSGNLALIPLAFFFNFIEYNIQGPFMGFEMAHWFAKGYFPASLLVRTDPREYFTTLGELFEKGF